MAEQKGKEMENVATFGTPGKNKEIPKQTTTCLHVSSCSLSSQAAKGLSEIGLLVTECPEIQQAIDTCIDKKLGMILLEDDVNKEFISSLKYDVYTRCRAKGSCNEQTPVIFISPDVISDDVKMLVKDQFIDDVLVRCSTLDSDLVKAVKRLINEPLQFAVTPKSKSKKSDGNTPKRQRMDNKTPMSARRCIANEFTSIDHNTEQLAMSYCYSQDQSQQNQISYTNLDSLPTSVSGFPALDSHVYPTAPVITHGHEQKWMPNYNYFSKYQETPQGIDTTNNNMQLLSTAAEMSQALASIQEHDLQLPGVKAVADNKEQECKPMDEQTFHQGKYSDTLHSVCQAQQVNQMQVALQNAERAIKSSFTEMLADELVPKITLSGARQLLDSALLGAKNKSPQREVQQECENDRYARNVGRSSRGRRAVFREYGANTSDDESSKRSQRGKCSYTYTEEKSTKEEEKSEKTSTAEDRKGLHLAKERKRRERIARSWHQLRRLIPMCDVNADKATVFEMTVAYVHHCWKHHADIVQIINKDFEKQFGDSGPPEDLDEIDGLVDKLLDTEVQ